MPSTSASGSSTSAVIVWPVPHVHRRLFGDRSARWVVHVAFPRFVTREVDAEDAVEWRVVEREHPVARRLDPPSLDELAQDLGIFRGDVVALRAVDRHVVQLPLVVVEPDTG